MCTFSWFVLEVLSVSPLRVNQYVFCLQKIELQPHQPGPQQCLICKNTVTSYNHKQPKSSVTYFSVFSTSRMWIWMWMSFIFGILVTMSFSEEISYNTLLCPTAKLLCSAGLWGISGFSKWYTAARRGMNTRNANCDVYKKYLSYDDDTHSMYLN